MTDEELQQHHNERWAELSPELQQQIMTVAVEALARVDNLPELRTHIAENPRNWAVPLHFFWGMWFRNQLRAGGVLDSMVPTGNLDDYYVRAVEEALPRIV